MSAVSLLFFIGLLAYSSPPLYFQRRVRYQWITMNGTAGISSAEPGSVSTFAAAYVSLIAFAFVFQSLPPVLRLILTDLKLSHAQGGLLMGLFALPGILLTIPGGWLADRYGFRRVGIGAIVSMLLGTLLTAGAGDFVWLAVGRLVSGVGAMILMVTAASLVSNTFRGPKLGPAMGLYNTGMPLGTIVCFNLLGSIGTAYGWRVAVLASSTAGVAALGLLLFRREPPIARRDHRGLKESLRSIDGRIWLVGACWLWFNAAAIAFLTFSPDYFMSLNHTPKTATFMAGFLMMGALVVSPAIGPLMGGAKRKERLIIVGSILPAAVYFALPYLVSRQLPLLVFLGLAAALVPAPLFALPAEFVGARQQGIAFGVLATCLNIGVLFGPFSVGLSRDLTGSYQVGFAVMAAFSLLAGLSMIPLLRATRTSVSRTNA